MNILLKIKANDSIYKVDDKALSGIVIFPENGDVKDVEVEVEVTDGDKFHGVVLSIKREMEASTNSPTSLYKGLEIHVENVQKIRSKINSLEIEVPKVEGKTLIEYINDISIKLIK